MICEWYHTLFNCSIQQVLHKRDMCRLYRNFTQPPVALLLQIIFEVHSVCVSSKKFVISVTFSGIGQLNAKLLLYSTEQDTHSALDGYR